MNEKDYFTNFHSHRFNCECGDKNKFSMLPIGELLPLLEIEALNLQMKLAFVGVIAKKCPDLLVDPHLVNTMIDRFQKTSDEWLLGLLKDSRFLLADLKEKGYKLVKSKVKKKRQKEDLDFYFITEEKFNSFIEKLKEEGILNDKS